MNAIITVLRNFFTIEEIGKFGAVCFVACTLLSLLIGARSTYQYFCVIRVKMEVDTTLRVLLRALGLSFKGGACLCGTICTMSLGILLCYDTIVFDPNMVFGGPLIMTVAMVAALSGVLRNGWRKSLHDQEELVEDVLAEYRIIAPTELPALETNSESLVAIATEEPSNAVSLKKPAREKEWVLRKSKGEWEKFPPGYPEINSCSTPSTPNFDSLKIVP